jgi:hypothetical protein
MMEREKANCIFFYCPFVVFLFFMRTSRDFRDKKLCALKQDLFIFFLDVTCIFINTDIYFSLCISDLFSIVTSTRSIA